MIRIGIIGYGYWGPNPVRNFADSRGAEVAAVADLDPARLATLSGECRLLEGAITKWTATLDPQNETAKSMRHVHAANARWSRNSGT